MPIYDYRCKGCGLEFETLVRGGEQAVCPSCGSTSLAKQMSPCSHRSVGADRGGGATASKSSGCSGCTSGSCSTCH